MEPFNISEQEKEISKQTTQFLAQYHLNALGISILAHLVKRGIPLTIFDIKNEFDNIDNQLLEKEIDFLYKNHYLLLQFDQKYYVDLAELQKERTQFQEKILKLLKTITIDTPIIQVNKIILQYFIILFDQIIAEIKQFDKIKLRNIRQRIKDLMIQTFQKISDNTFNKAVLKDLSKALENTQEQLNLNQFYELVKNSILNQTLIGKNSATKTEVVNNPQIKIESNTNITLNSENSLVEAKKKSSKISKSKKKTEPEQSNPVHEEEKPSEKSTQEEIAGGLLEKLPENSPEIPVRKKSSRKKSSKKTE